MAVHTIVIPDRLRGREPRTIIWDDAAGTVDGTHSQMPHLRQRFEEPKPVQIGDLGVSSLQDPAHDPSKFLALLIDIYRPLMEEPLRSTPPAVFDRVSPPAPDLGPSDEEITERDGGTDE